MSMMGIELKSDVYVKYVVINGWHLRDIFLEVGGALHVG